MKVRNRPKPTLILTEFTVVDLFFIGAYISRLYYALLAKGFDPTLDVLLLEVIESVNGPGGRKSGFIDRCLVYTFENELESLSDELPNLVQMGYGILDSKKEVVNG